MASMVRDAVVKFTRELFAKLVIRSVSDTAIRINDEEYSDSVALTPKDILGNWPNTPIAALTIADFAEIFEAKPEIVLLGTGSSNVFPPRELTFAFARNGVGLEVMDTAAAARTFNVLANESRRVAAVLYL
jgi:uncharacterized protein